MRKRYGRRLLPRWRTVFGRITDTSTSLSTSLEPGFHVSSLITKDLQCINHPDGDPRRPFEEHSKHPVRFNLLTRDLSYCTNYALPETRKISTWDTSISSFCRSRTSACLSFNANLSWTLGYLRAQDVLPHHCTLPAHSSHPYLNPCASKPALPIHTLRTNHNQ